MSMSTQQKPQNPLQSRNDVSAFPAPSLKSCTAPGSRYVTSGPCSHGKRIVRPLNCNECENCQNRRRAKHRKRIWDGIRNRPGKYYFLTLTLCPHRRWNGKRDRCPTCERCEATAQEPSAAALLAAWRKFVHWWNSIYGYHKTRRPDRENMRYYRVVECHKSGLPHLHVVLEQAPGMPGFIPAIYKANNRESLASYRLRQMPIAAEWMGRFQWAGFGPIMHNVKAYQDGEGCASYMTKYMTKTDDTFRDAETGRRIRQFESSRNWNPQGMPEKEFYETPTVMENSRGHADADAATLSWETCANPEHATPDGDECPGHF